MEKPKTRKAVQRLCGMISSLKPWFPNINLYRAKCINIYTDASALEGIFQKNLGDIQNKRIRDMVEKLMCYNFKFHHIPGKSNKIADCFSRITRRIRETEHFDISEPILADHATIKKVGEKVWGANSQIFQWNLK